MAQTLSLLTLSWIPLKPMPQKHHHDDALTLKKDPEKTLMMNEIHGKHVHHEVTATTTTRRRA